MDLVHTISYIDLQGAEQPVCIQPGCPLPRRIRDK